MTTHGLLLDMRPVTRSQVQSIRRELVRLELPVDLSTSIYTTAVYRQLFRDALIIPPERFHLDEALRKLTRAQAHRLIGMLKGYVRVGS